jgi:hypothetical protein
MALNGIVAEAGIGGIRKAGSAALHLHPDEAACDAFCGVDLLDLTVDAAARRSPARSAAGVVDQ